MNGPPPQPSDEAPGELPSHDDNGVDLALIRAFLKLTPTERIARLQDMADFVEQVRAGAARRAGK
jgi:hypothetical protein